MNRRFQFATAAAGLALAVGAVVGLRPAPVDVDVERVTRGPFEQALAADGRAQIHERYTISAPMTGTLSRMLVQEGDVVLPGAVVGRLLPLASPLLDPESRKGAEQRLASSKASEEQARAVVTRAKLADEQSHREVERSDALLKRGATTAADLERAEVDARLRDAELSSATFAELVAEHEVEQARIALLRFTPGAGGSDQFEITSPARAQVLHVLHKSEGVVSAGTALLEVGDQETIELVADVLSQDAVAMKPGMQVRVVHWGGDAPLSGRVRRIEPAAFTRTSALGVDEQRVNAIIQITSPRPEWESLGDGFAVEVEITLWSKADALQIPTSAIFRDDNGWAAFVVDNEHSKKTAIQVGHRGPLRTEVTAGLHENDRVIVHPGASIRNGIRVSYR